MPGFDGTGPLGQGPMTGRGQGMCVVPEGNFSRPSGVTYFGRGLGRAMPGFGRGFGYGRGFGRGRGWGRGFGRWAGYPYAYGNPYEAPSYPVNFTPKQEADMLKAEAKAMQEDIEAINKRLKDIESAQE